MKKICISVLVLILIVLVNQVNAERLVLSVVDPYNDQSGLSPDLIGMELVFDNETGFYIIELTASNDKPFIGMLRININIFNLDVGTILFADTLNDIYLTESTTTIKLGGKSNSLYSWDVEDEILLNNWPDGNPNPGSGISLFASGVSLLQDQMDKDMLGTEKQIDIISIAPPSIDDAYNCIGFKSPLNYPIFVNNDRAIPVKAQLFYNWNIVNDEYVTFPPIIQISSPEIQTESYEFEYNDKKEWWEFHLKTEKYIEPGTYFINIKSGDENSYTINTCYGTFVIE